MPQQMTFMSTDKQGIKFELEEIVLKENELLSSEEEAQYIDRILNGVEGVDYQFKDRKNMIYEMQSFFTPSIIKDFFEVIEPSRMSYQMIVFESEQARLDYLDRINGKSMKDQIALFKQEIPFGSKNSNYKQN